MMDKKPIRLWVGICFAVLFLWLVLRQITLDDIWRAFIGINYGWITAAQVAFALDFSCRIERWRLMIELDSPDLKWRRCAGPFLASYAANNVLPFRAGDALRAFAFNKKLGATPGVVIATLFIERMLDLIVLSVIFGVAIAIFIHDMKQFLGIGSAALIAAAIAFLSVLIFPRLISPIVRAIARLVLRIAPSFGSKLFIEINKSLNTVSNLTQRGVMFKLVLWSILAWLSEGCVFWFTAMALPALAIPLAAWLALPTGTLATLIPSTPGYVGTFDFFTVQAMTRLGNDPSAAAAYALVLHALLWIWPTFLGGLYLLILHFEKQEKLKGDF